MSDGNADPGDGGLPPGGVGGVGPLGTAPVVPPFQPPFLALLDRYMDSHLPIFADSDVTPLIQGTAYFPSLAAAINTLSGDITKQFIYITGWLLDPDFSLAGVGGAPTVIDLLAAKAKAGADVCVLGWIMPPTVLPKVMARGGDPGGMLSINRQTMSFIDKLRKAEPNMAEKAVLNILSHPAGAVHMKMAIVGSDSQTTGFTGGMDMGAQRHWPTWHDVSVMVKGSVLQTFVEAFRLMWNEIQKRPAATVTINTLPKMPPITMTTHSSAMGTLSARLLAGASSKTLRTQSVRTLPKFDFPWWTSISSVLPTNDPLSYAPNGLMEVKQVWQKAISAAQTYIYIEDQGFSSSDVYDWINTVFKASPKMRVIIVTGVKDPNDAPNNRSIAVFNSFINNNLLKGITAQADLDRIGIFSHKTKIVHTKSTIVDDQWALIGSANCMRRGLFTDFEHSVSFMDEAGTAVPAYRTDLWGKHLSSQIPDLNAALAAWFANPAALARLKLPLPATPPLSADDQIMYDEIDDANSQNTWGNGLKTLKSKKAGSSS